MRGKVVQTVIKLKNLFSKIQEHANARLIFVDGAGRSEITFAQFADLIKEKMAIIHAANLRPRQRIGLLGPNSLDWMAWDIAILNSEHIPIVFTDEHANLDLVSLMNKYNCALFVADNSKEGIPGVIKLKAPVLATFLPEVDLEISDTEDTLTLVFSSGTTGRTKGLRISKIGTEHILNQFVAAYKVTDKDKYYSFLPFNYFQQRALYYVSLFLGIDTVIVPPEQFLKHFQTESPTYTINPPIFYESIFNYVQAMEKLGHSVSLKVLLGGNIRWMITAMAPIRREVLEYFWDSGISLYETYGVTETGIVAWNTLEDYKVGTVGKPASDGEIILTDANEVLIKRSKPLTIDYFDVSSEEVSEVFKGDGSVTTGDVASIDDEGYITLVGRTKNAVVTPQGKKFHPEQIEALIEKKLRGWVPIIVGGAGICQNTLLLAPANDSVPLDVANKDISACIQEINDSNETHKHIHAAFLLKKPLSAADGFLTRNFKLDRRNIEKALVAGKFNEGEQSIKKERVFGIS
jgi:long-chain acyl-CoA synthetase